MSSRGSLRSCSRGRLCRRSLQLSLRGNAAAGWRCCLRNDCGAGAGRLGGDAWPGADGIGELNPRAR